MKHIDACATLHHCRLNAIMRGGEKTRITDLESPSLINRIVREDEFLSRQSVDNKAPPFEAAIDRQGMLYNKLSRANASLRDKISPGHVDLSCPIVCRKSFVLSRL